MVSQMSRLTNTGSQSGQALIEILLIMPIALMFLTAIGPILTQSLLHLWLGEITQLQLSLPMEDEIINTLQKNRNESRLPEYLDKEEIGTFSDKENIFPMIPPLDDFFPGQLITRTTTYEHTPMGIGQQGIFKDDSSKKLTLTSRMALVPPHTFEETDLPSIIRNVAFCKIPGRYLNSIEKMGLKTVHLNLDTLPAAQKPGEKR